MTGNILRTGVYVDIPDISRNGGRGLRFDTLRKFATRGGAEAMHLNAYTIFDNERAAEDRRYKDGTHDFFRILRDFGFKVYAKPLSWFEDEDGAEHPKANIDLELAVDAMSQGHRLDRVVLLTGDGEYVRLIRGLQQLGCRVEVIGFKNMSERLRLEADHFISGYLIPGLLPTPNSGGAQWGEPESRVRGICYDFRADRGFGFLRFIKQLDGAMWITDTRQEGSAYDTAFVHATELEKAHIPLDDLPSRDLVLEFELTIGKKDGFEAKNISLVHRYGSPSTAAADPAAV